MLRFATFLLTAAIAMAIPEMGMAPVIQELMDMVEMATIDPVRLASTISSSSLAAIVNIDTSNVTKGNLRGTYNGLPVVFGHGMGDSCFNSGMKSITKSVAKHMGVYGTCIPTGNTQPMDTINGFLQNMDKSVDVFAAKIKADPKLGNGFNAIGFSQGNSLIRGYIQKYNDPVVNVALHVHGTVQGVQGLPGCNPKHDPICRVVADTLGTFAYNPLVQRLLFQAGYFRIPAKLNSTSYKMYSQIGRWNNEGVSLNATFKENFGKTKKFVMVKAERDSMVYPNEGEWWGEFADATMNKVLPMRDTAAYKSDSFGLKTADEEGKIYFESTKGGHLDFSISQLIGWVDKYM